MTGIRHHPFPAAAADGKAGFRHVLSAIPSWHGCQRFAVMVSWLTLKFCGCPPVEHTSNP